MPATVAMVLTRARRAGRSCRDSVGDTTREEIASLRRALTATGREVRRTTWREAVQARTTRIARVLRVAARAVRGRGQRVRDGRGWVLNAVAGVGEVAAVLQVITRVATRSLEDLGAPVPVVVVRRDLVDLAVLDALGDSVTLSFAEVG